MTNDENEISNLFNTYFINIIYTLPNEETVPTIEVPNISNDYFYEILQPGRMTWQDAHYYAKTQNGRLPSLTEG